MKFNTIVEHLLNENPDLLWSENNAVAFFYFHKASELFKVLKKYVEELRGDYDRLEPTYFDKGFKPFMKHYKINPSKPLLIMGDDKGIYFNTKRLYNGGQSFRYLGPFHEGILTWIAYRILDFIPEYEDKDLSPIFKYKFGPDVSRFITTTGRLVPNYKNDDGYISFWKLLDTSDVEEVYKIANKVYKLKSPVQIEVPPKRTSGNSLYDEGDIYIFEPKKQKIKQVSTGDKIDTIDVVRARRWPGLKFESLMENKNISAGIAMYTDDGKVFLVKPTGLRSWGIPKGRQDKGEDLFHTAIREFNEETGIALSPNKRDYIQLGIYINGKKKLHVWAIKGDGNEKFKGSNLITSGPRAGLPENNAGAYWKIDKAYSVIHKYQKPILDDLKELLQ